MRAASHLPLLLIVGLAVTLVGCDEEAKKGTSGNAKVAFANGSTDLALAPDTYTPTYFGFKLMNVHIQQELDTTKAPASQIYVSSACEKDDLKGEVENDQTGGEKKEYAYVGIRNCNADAETKFFDLARSTDEVNADLNAQGLPVLPGTYKYASLSMCQGTPANPNVEFQTEGMSEAEQVKSGTCGVISAEMVPPLEIKEGESVVISLAYDLAGIVYDYGDGMSKSDNCWFSDDGTVRRCVNFPNLVPSATKQ